MLASLFIIGFKHDTIFFLQRQHQFEGIDRIQCQAIIGKKQGVVADLSRRNVFQIHRFDDERFQFLMQRLMCHIHRSVRNLAQFEAREAESFFIVFTDKAQCVATAAAQAGGHGFSVGNRVKTDAEQ